MFLSKFNKGSTSPDLIEFLAASSQHSQHTQQSNDIYRQQQLIEKQNLLNCSPKPPQSSSINKPTTTSSTTSCTNLKQTSNMFLFNRTSSFQMHDPAPLSPLSSSSSSTSPLINQLISPSTTINKSNIKPIINNNKTIYNINNNNILSIFILHSSNDFYISACLDETLIDESLLNGTIKNLDYKPSALQSVKLDVVFASNIIIRNKNQSQQQQHQKCLFKSPSQPPPPPPSLSSRLTSQHQFSPSQTANRSLNYELNRSTTNHHNQYHHHQHQHHPIYVNGEDVLLKEQPNDNTIMHHLCNQHHQNTEIMSPPSITCQNQHHHHHEDTRYMSENRLLESYYRDIDRNRGNRFNLLYKNNATSSNHQQQQQQQHGQQQKNQDSTSLNNDFENKCDKKSQKTANSL
jgi:hypothetical protein